MNRFFRNHPPWLTLEVTNRCNYDCAMCHVQSKDGLEFGNIELEQVKNFVDDIKKAQSVTAGLRLFWLGEPTIHPQFGEILRLFQDPQLSKNGLIPRIGFDTNGTNLERWIPEILALARVMPLHIILSLDAVRDKTYQQIRRGGELGHVVKGLQALLRARMKENLLFPKITLQFIVMDENADELAEFLTFFTAEFRKFAISPTISLNASFADGDGFNIRPMTWQGEEASDKQATLHGLYVRVLEQNNLLEDSAFFPSRRREE
jgi:MoaA/NifB/PqqE/SkfB family radical SAM enzyme